MADNINYTVERTRENERTLQVGGSKIYLRRQDPFGFWYVSFERGAVPAILDQAFTTLDFAYATIDTYIAKNAERQKSIERERVKNAKTNFESKPE